MQFIWLALGLLAAFSNAVNVDGKIYNYRFEDDNSTTLLVTSLNDYTTLNEFPNTNGDFTLKNLQNGQNYRLNINSNSIESLVSYEIHILKNEAQVWEVPVNTAFDEQLRRVELPLLINKYRRTQLLQKRSSFGVFKFITQPTVLLSLAALAFTIFIPALLRNIDPELLNQMREQQGLKEEE